ncbi:MAG: riboflavin synthase [Planctomycetota bacterium]
MFTGLVEVCTTVASVEARGTGVRLSVARPAPSGSAAGAFDPAVGDSVAVSGCCLTVTKAGGDHLAFDVSSETLARTWFRGIEPGRRVNLERALRLGDRLDGHMVSGHVDAVGVISGIEDTGDGGWRLAVDVPRGFERWLVDKGSVTVDGISLTVVEPAGQRFYVAVIPHTIAVTHLATARVGQEVNLEADLVGKWVERLARRT